MSSSKRHNKTSRRSRKSQRPTWVFGLGDQTSQYAVERDVDLLDEAYTNVYWVVVGDHLGFEEIMYVANETENYELQIRTNDLIHAYHLARERNGDSDYDRIQDSQKAQPIRLLLTSTSIALSEQGFNYNDPDLQVMATVNWTPNDGFRLNEIRLFWGLDPETFKWCSKRPLQLTSKRLCP